MSRKRGQGDWNPTSTTAEATFRSSRSPEKVRVGWAVSRAPRWCTIAHVHVGSRLFFHLSLDSETRFTRHAPQQPNASPHRGLFWPVRRQCSFPDPAGHVSEGHPLFQHLYHTSLRTRVLRKYVAAMFPRIVPFSSLSPLLSSFWSSSFPISHLLAQF